MDRSPTQSDVAQAAGVSRGLVSLALSNSPGVSAQTRERILKTAQELGYVRNLSAASLAGGLPTAVGVVLPDLRNPFFEDLVAEVNKQTSAEGLLPLIVTSSDSLDREETAIRKLQEMRVEGCLVVSPSAPDAMLLSLAEAAPMVIFGIEPIGGHVDVVHMDEEAAGQLIAAHLAEGPWNSVLHISCRDGNMDRSLIKRAGALETAIRARGLEFTHAPIETGEPLVPLLRDFLDQQDGKPVAVTTHNDLQGADMVTAVRALGLEPGKDIAIVSFDDSHMSARPEFQLSSVRQNTEYLITEALKMLKLRSKSRLDPPREAVSWPSLTVRITG